MQRALLWRVTLREDNHFVWEAGSLSLALSADEALTGYHQGQCDDDCAYLRTLPHIEAQLAAMDAATLADYLRGYSAWYADQLSDHDENLTRLIWLVCGELVDEYNLRG